MKQINQLIIERKIIEKQIIDKNIMEILILNNKTNYVFIRFPLIWDNFNINDTIRVVGSLISFKNEKLFISCKHIEKLFFKI